MRLRMLEGERKVKKSKIFPRLRCQRVAIPTVADSNLVGTRCVVRKICFVLCFLFSRTSLAGRSYDVVVVVVVLFICADVGFRLLSIL